MSKYAQLQRSRPLQELERIEQGIRLPISEYPATLFHPVPEPIPSILQKNTVYPTSRDRVYGPSSHNYASLRYYGNGPY